MPSVKDTFGVHSVDVNQNTGFTETKFTDNGFKTTSFTETSFHNGKSTKSSLNALIVPARNSNLRQLSQANSKEGISPSTGVGTRSVASAVGGSLRVLTENPNKEREYYPSDYVRSVDGIMFIKVNRRPKKIYCIDQDDNEVIVNLEDRE